jgi:hypothetical protein
MAEISGFTDVWAKPIPVKHRNTAKIRKIIQSSRSAGLLDQAGSIFIVAADGGLY